jgi:hypothetical protein
MPFSGVFRILRKSNEASVGQTPFDVLNEGLMDSDIPHIAKAHVI